MTFAEKRMFAIPLDTFVEIEISGKQARKIRRWIKDGDVIGVFPYAHGNVLVLTNATKLWGSKDH
jgi:hypothetical protein